MSCARIDGTPQAAPRLRLGPGAVRFARDHRQLRKLTLVPVDSRL